MARRFGGVPGNLELYTVFVYSWLGLWLSLAWALRLRSHELRIVKYIGVSVARADQATKARTQEQL